VHAMVTHVRHFATMSLMHDRRSMDVRFHWIQNKHGRRYRLGSSRLRACRGGYVEAVNALNIIHTRGQRIVWLGHVVVLHCVR
jgi:hypothetical protein